MLIGDVRVLVLLPIPGNLFPFIAIRISTRLVPGRVLVILACSIGSLQLRRYEIHSNLRFLINGDIRLVCVLRHLVAAHLRLLGLRVCLCLSLHLHLLLPLWEIVEPWM